MHIRRASVADIDEIGKLYRDTITTVNAKDYSKEQINAWASTYNNTDGWIRRIEEQHFYVAAIEDTIIGFASLDNNGYLDLLYVHKDYQGRGIATKLTDKLEKVAREMELPEVTVQSSITSKPFFEVRGYKPTGEKHKTVNGIAFNNTIMAKKM